MPPVTYFLFLDESGDHGLDNIDPQFPVFILGGIILTEDAYTQLNTEVNALKKSFWLDKKVILHSRDIRKCEKEFAILFDLELKRKFYEEINQIIVSNDYHIIATAIEKSRYIRKFGRLADDVYEVALSTVVEQSLNFIKSHSTGNAILKIIIEQRGKKEDDNLRNHFRKLQSRGLNLMDKKQFSKFKMEFEFSDKKDNINGLQIADLIAYPSARYILNPERANPAIDIFKSKIYPGKGKRFGIKLLP
jgi:hypothetical protein